MRRVPAAGREICAAQCIAVACETLQTDASQSTDTSVAAVLLLSEQEHHTDPLTCMKIMYEYDP